MIALALLACTPDAADPYAVPEGATASWYEPDVALTTFPDDLHTVEADTPTGLAVRFYEPARADLDAQIPDDFTLIEALEALDGFGTSAGILLRFTAALDPASVTPDTVQLLRLDGEPEALAWEATWTDDDQTLILFPLRPLEPATLHGVVAAGLTDAVGEPVWAAPDLRALLLGQAEGEHFERLAGRYAALVDAAPAAAEDLQAAAVFTTQSLFEEDDAIAAFVAGESYAIQPGACAGDGAVHTCEVSLEVWDFLGEDDILGAPEAQRAYTLPVDIHLPAEGQGPFPVMIYGHGLGGDRGEAGGVARNLADLGLAVAAIDAPSHGEHPAGVNSIDLFWIFEFFGIDAATFGFEVRQLRDGWRRAAWDKLQLARALRAGPDVDGDGVADIDGSRIVFAGHSLGATMGAQLMRLDPEVLAGELATPGGRVTEIVHHGEIFEPVIALMAPEGTGQGEIDRFFPMLQAAIERGDGVNHAAGVLDGRRDLLVTQVIDDTIIPNAATRVLARALGVEHAPPILQEVEGLAPAAALPLSANLDGRTALLYQFDEMVDDGALIDATHTHIHSSESGVDQYRHFWQSWLETGLAEVIDPMAE